MHTIPIYTHTYHIHYIHTSYIRIETNVSGTNVNYEELNRTALLPFTQKVEWLKLQFTSIRTPWEEGHIKIRVRREALLQDSMDAWESIEAGKRECMCVTGSVCVYGVLVYCI